MTRRKALTIALSVAGRIRTDLRPVAAVASPSRPCPTRATRRSPAAIAASRPPRRSSRRRPPRRPPRRPRSPPPRPRPPRTTAKKASTTTATSTVKSSRRPATTARRRPARPPRQDQELRRPPRSRRGRATARTRSDRRRSPSAPLWPRTRRATWIVRRRRSSGVSAAASRWRPQTFGPPHYYFSPVAIGFLAVYGVSFALYRTRRMKVTTHRKIWNMLLMGTFLLCGLIGLLLAVGITRSTPWSCPRGCWCGMWRPASPCASSPSSISVGMLGTTWPS